MARELVQLGATIVGAMVGGPIGAIVGNFIGGMIGAMLFPPTAEGPRLDDLTPQASEYGRPLAKVYGTIGIQGTVIWASDLVEESEEDDGITTYKYYANLAIAVAESDGGLGLGRIWAGHEKRLVYDGTMLEGGEVRWYDGASDQMPDALIESYDSPAPAYRGTAYVVLERFPLAKDGNRIPPFTIEVGKTVVGTNTGPDNIGIAWFQDLHVTDTRMYVFYFGSYNGIIIRELADYTFYRHYTFPSIAWGSTGQFIIDEDNGQIVYWNYGPTSYGLINIATGAATYHALPDLPAEDLGEHIFGCVYRNGKYIFATNQAASGMSRIGLWVVNPTTQVVEATYGSNTGASAYALSMDAPPGSSASHVYVLSPGRVTQHTFVDEAAPTLLGTADTPPYTHYPHFMRIDPYSGYVWTFYYNNDSHELTVRIFGTGAALGDTVVHNAMATDFNGLAWSEPVVFTGGVDGDYVHIFGQYSYHSDYAMTFDRINQTVIGVYNVGYRGTVDIHAVGYNSVEHQLFAIRYNGIVTNGAIGDTSDPRTVNYIQPGTFEAELDNWYIADRGESNFVAISGEPLSDVVTDLCEQAGLSAAQINVTALTDTVDGYAIVRQTTVADAIKALMPAYYFDAVESEGRIKFVKRGGVAVAIDEDQMGAYQSGSEPAKHLITVRGMEDELPKVVYVNYLLAATRYSKATKRAHRQVGDTENEHTIDLPLVLTDTKGQEIAEVNLHGPVVERTKYEFSLSRAYSHIEPTDIVAFDVRGYTVRIVKMTYTNGFFKCEAVHDDTNVYTPVVMVTETPPDPGTVDTPVEADGVGLELMDIAMARDEDDDPGFYAAVSLIDQAATWNGASIYRSVDGGSNYLVKQTMGAEATMGGTTSVLGNFLAGNIIDELNRVNVVLSNGSLASTTLLNMLHTTNLCVIGDEILSFRDATLESDGSYTLSGLLRGRRGTEWAMSTHEVGERFVLLTTTTVARPSGTLGEIGQSYLYKAVPSGGTLSETTADTFANSAAGLKPYSPVHLGGGVEANNDWTLKWIRRGRVDGTWRDGVDVPLTETVESYEIEIWDVDYTTLKRTLTSSSQSVTYTSAQQTTDFGSAPQTDVYFVVYQMSSTVGRGYPAYSHTRHTGTGTVVPPPLNHGTTIQVYDWSGTLHQTANNRYWIEDGVWGAGSLTQGTYDGLTQYEQYIGLSPTIGTDGQISWRMMWKWPVGETEVKSYPSAIYGAKPGYYNTWTTPGGHTLILPDGTENTVFPSGETPGHTLPQQLPINPIYSSYAYTHLVTPTGRGHLTYDIWLQSTPTQVNGFSAPPISHEIMIPVNYWGEYGAYPHRNPAWYDHDATIDGVLYHVYVYKDPVTGGVTAGFAGGWKWITFEPDSPTALGFRTLNLASFINYLRDQYDPVTGTYWATNEYLVSIELGVEPVEGTGDLVVSNYRIWE